MENSGYKVVSNRSDQRKRFLIAFISFALALGFVIAVFSLTLGRRTREWMDGTAGFSRSTVFPYPFVSGSSLYVLRDSHTVEEVDNNVKNAVYDPVVNAVYYVYEPTAELYEYSVNDRSRVKLCGGVDTFSLFKDRTYIAFVSTSGGICIYSYNSKKVSTLRNGSAVGNIAADAPPFYAGVSSVYFFDEFDPAAGTATLKQWKMSGAVTVIAENVLNGQGLLVWPNDRAVGFYTPNGFCIDTRDGNETAVGTGFSPILPEAPDYTDTGFDAVERFDCCTAVRYLCSRDENSGKLSIYSVSVSAQTVKTAFIAGGVSDVIGYDDADEILIYRIDRSENESAVYKTQKGGKPQELFLADAGSELMLEPVSNCVYIKSPDGVATFVEIFDKARTKHVVSNAAASLSPYYRKPFAVVTNAKGSAKTIVINRNISESYNISETRLYGKADNVFLLLRENDQPDRVSLDFSSASVLKRITGDCVKASIVFDKNIEHVVYYGSGALYVYTEGESVLVAEFEQETLPVPVATY
ncbi:MAG: hypothetical protein ILO53_06550 [Clostridia bacterium]|nr:hypothetical protein [Clostridia bacterium]